KADAEVEKIGVEKKNLPEVGKDWSKASDSRAEIYFDDKVDKVEIAKKDINCRNRTMMMNCNKKDKDLKEDTGTTENDKKT
ncbi:20146_t:CDS:2, partial [Racocetra persica]